MTGLKKELIEASRSEAQREAADLGQALVDHTGPAGLAMKEIEAWVRTNIAGRVFDSDHELRKTMCEVGCMVVPKRLKVGGRLQYVVINSALAELVQKASEEDYLKGIREKIITPGSLIGESM